jgi:hypothetical protein
MKTLFGATMAALLIACVAASPALAQKTAKACREEWRASTDPNKGTEKDYVAKCRAVGAAAAPAAPAAAPTAAPEPAAGGKKTARACREEWRASTDPNKGTEKDYVAKCRGGATAAAPAAPAPPAPAAAEPAAGAKKTARACRDEWRASTDPNKGTEKDYVAKCRGGETAAAPAAPGPAPTAAPAAPEPAAGGKKTARACRDEWRASTDPNKGTEKDYVAKCRTGATAAAPAAPAAEPKAAAPAAPPPAPAATAPAPAPAPTAAAPPPAAPAPAAPARPAPTAAPKSAAAPAAPTGANQFSTEAQAKARCPADTIVWVNLDSKIYHFAGTRNYGKTKEGAYMCEKDALNETFRASKTEKHP